MNSIKCLILACIFSSCLPIIAEDTELSGYKLNNNFDVSLSYSGNQSSIVLSWVKFHSIIKKKRFKIGYGIRFTSQFGKNLDYITAPAKLTSKQKGPQVLFSESFPENIDTFKIYSTQYNALNININLQYTIKQKIDVGFNIDTIGTSFGKETQGTYISHQSSDNSKEFTSSPTKLNALLVIDNDIGMLNSELYVRYWFKPKRAIRAGASFLFTEYTTDAKLILDNDRWRNKSLMSLVAITFSPFK